MNIRKLRLAFALLIAFVLSVASDGRAFAQAGAGNDEAGSLSRRISLAVGKSVEIELPSEASEVVIANPKLADAIVRTARRLYIVGVAAGQTTIFASDANGRQIAHLEVNIGRDVAELAQLLRISLPRSDITARTVNDTIILTGTVRSAGEALRAVDIAKGFLGAGSGQGDAVAPSGGGGAASGGGSAQNSHVVNALVVQGEDQVMVKVTVSEISRRVLKQLGFSSAATATDTLLQGGWGSFVAQNPYGINELKSKSALTVLGTKVGGTTATATLKAFERYGVARVLSEPTVTAISGESAKLVVGGEVPVPSAFGQCLFGAAGTNAAMGGQTTGALGCTPGITFKPYGVTLNFTPTVLSEGRILLHVGTEVTEVDRKNSFTYADITVPAFITRKHDTTVELPSGGSIAAAGLLLEKSDQAITGLPALLDIPVIGQLFRSRDYQKDETELLIVITPFIVKPVSAQEIARPTDGFAEASDPQAWLLGRVNRIYASRNNPQLPKNFKGRIGFIQD
jgi:pilus assembly protein CpaC